MKRIFISHLVAVILVLICPVILAEELKQAEDWPLCPSSLDIPARPRVPESLAIDEVHIMADQADLAEQGVSVLEGNVEITRGSQQVRADTVTYDNQAEKAEMQGNIEFWDDSIYLQGESGQVDFIEKDGVFTRSNYRIIDNRGRGEAENVYHHDVQNYSDLNSVTYSTCDPEDNFWKLSAGSIHLDHEKEQGSARNVVLRIKDMPVFYTPYISFPLSDKRKTGFLYPNFGTSRRSGFDVRTPYYLNLAPNMDATIAPRLLTDRGLMLIGQYRYLLRHGLGEINAEYLPSDNQSDDDHRNLVSFKHTQWIKGGRIHLDYNRVSDKRYFEDFGSTLSTTSTRFLLQRALISYSGSGSGYHWGLSGNLQNYQSVDRTLPANFRPYKRLPQIQFNAYTPRANNRLNLNLRSEFVYYDRDGIPTIPTANVNGIRLDVLPSISYPMHTASTFLIPKVSARYTQYSLSDTGAGSFESSPYRLLPVVSIDSGVFLERETTLFNRTMVQTLEPRLFYLYIPGENQADLPVFDTSLYDFTFSSLFREDRFSGPDRMGDANQFTLGLTSRLLNYSTGQEIGYLSLGQIFYLADRNVILPGGVKRDEDSSPFVAEIGTSIIDDWLFLGNVQWDPNNNKTEKITAAIQYNPAPDTVVNLAYRLRDSTNSITSSRRLTDIEQTDVSFNWPFNQNWNIIGRWNYSIKASKSLDIFGGLEYESCCWAFRAIARRFLTDIDGEFETGIFFQIELKGLAGLGTKTEEFLEQHIPGYQSSF